jgi:hypothetical protein
VYDAIAEFLLNRVAEDEAVARAAVGRGVHDDRPEVKEWIGLANPQRMLNWSQVRRELIALHTRDDRTADDPAAETCAECGHAMPCRTMMLLANLYADHPDFQEQWRQELTGCHVR